MSCNSHQQIDYPITDKIVVIDTYFETQIEDPYRWLEDDKDKKVKQWIESQNQLTFSYLDEIPYREALRNRLEKLWNYEKIGTPFKEGNYTYFYKNDGLQNQSVLYRKKGDDNEEVFINPNIFWIKFFCYFELISDFFRMSANLSGTLLADFCSVS